MNGEEETKQGSNRGNKKDARGTQEGNEPHPFKDDAQELEAKTEKGGDALRAEQAEARKAAVEAKSERAKALHAVLSTRPLPEPHR